MHGKVCGQIVFCLLITAHYVGRNEETKQTTGEIQMKKHSTFPQHTFKVIGYHPAMGKECSAYLQDENGDFWYMGSSGRPGRCSETSIEEIKANNRFVEIDHQ